MITNSHDSKLTNLFAVVIMLIAVLASSLALPITVFAWIWALFAPFGMNRRTLVVLAIALTVWTAALYLVFGATIAHSSGSDQPIQVQ